MYPSWALAHRPPPPPPAVTPGDEQTLFCSHAARFRAAFHFVSRFQGESLDLLDNLHSFFHPLVESADEAVAGVEAEFLHHPYCLTGAAAARAMHDIRFRMIQFLNVGFEISIIEIEVLTSCYISARMFSRRPNIKNTNTIFTYLLRRIFNSDFVVHVSILAGIYKTTRRRRRRGFSTQKPYYQASERRRNSYFILLSERWEQARLCGLT